MTSYLLSEFVSVKQRFARSVNVERDNLVQGIEGYILTGRALDVVARVVAVLSCSTVDRAFSLTGPYGSGKSSLALFLSALFGPAGTTRNLADKLLATCDSSLAEQLFVARAKGGKDGCQRGFVLCTAVAQRESVAVTLFRALRAGAIRYAGSEACARKRKEFAGLFDCGETPAVSALCRMVERVASVAPVLLVLDEFGKNLEQFAATGSAEDDLFLLQEIAEWAVLPRSYPVLLLTLQHLAFEDYVAGISVTQRREWSKVQGRFVDIPYVESAAQAQTLISSVFESKLDVSAWAAEMRCVADKSGFSALLHVDIEQLYPLHLLTVLVLPELCARYGQNERTLFSFLASSSPGAVPTFLEQCCLSEMFETKTSEKTQKKRWGTAESEFSGDMLPCVRLNHVYDFFLQANSTMASASVSASRWIEIETRIRDVAGLGPGELRVLKTVAVLNLVAAGGVLRASRPMIIASAADNEAGTKDAAEVEARLADLETRGIVTYREFADEYRIWSGSDFDVQSAVRLARYRLESESVAAVLERVRPQTPVVAARHSQRTGILRVFERHYVDAMTEVCLDERQVYDGAVLLCVDLEEQVLELNGYGNSRPVLLATVSDPRQITSLAEAARDLAAHVDVLHQVEAVSIDWVVIRELRERVAAAMAVLDVSVERIFGFETKFLEWQVLGRESVQGGGCVFRSLSARLSDVCDRYYFGAPVIRNEMLSRRKMTSQGVRARRELIEAMVTCSGEPFCGIEGYGPQRAMYEAILSCSGIHRERHGEIGFGPPVSEQTSSLGFELAWTVIEDFFREAEASLFGVDEIYRRLLLPPVGLREGLLPVLFIAAFLSYSDRLALYENGSFVARLELPVVHRLLRNPDLFSVKSYAVSGARAAVVRRFSAMLQVPDTSAKQLKKLAKGKGRSRVASVVRVVGPLLKRVQSLPLYTQKTRRMTQQALAVRSALFTATEPDELLFSALPQAVEVASFASRDVYEEMEIIEFVSRVEVALSELESCFGVLRNHLEKQLGSCFSVQDNDARLIIADRVSQFSDAVFDSDITSFVLGLTDTALDRDEWLDYLGMIVTGKAPMNWVDEDLHRFDLRLRELTASVRRLENLYYERCETPCEGFEAVQIGFTTAKGVDRQRVVWVDKTAQAGLDVFVIEALALAEQLLGPPGREMLLARFVQGVLGDDTKLVDTCSEGGESGVCAGDVRTRQRE